MTRPVSLVLACAAMIGVAGAQTYGIPDGRTSTGGDRLPELSQPAALAANQRVFQRDGIWYIRAVPGDTPDTLARDAYGNPELWFLLIHHNQERMANRGPGEQEPLDLVIPPPPRHRVTPVGEEVLLRTIPGDTLQGIASDIYGDPEAWRAVAQANPSLPAEPEAPIVIDENQRMSLIVLPRPPDVGNRTGSSTGGGTVARTPDGTGSSGSTGGGWGAGGYRSGTSSTTGSSTGSTAGRDQYAGGFTGGSTYQGGSGSPYALPSPRTGAGTVDWGNAVGGAGDPLVRSPQPRGRTSTAGTGSSWGNGGYTGASGSRATGPLPLPSASQASASPLPGGLASLRVRSPRDIGPQEAATILQATGFTHSRIINKHTPPARNEMEAALMALSWGNTYKRPKGPVALDGQSQQWLFEAYQQLQEAQNKYRGWPDISRRSNPQAYERWVVEASSQLTNVPQGQRVALMRSLMQTETGQTHWNGYTPVVSHSGAVGFGQFLPATARGLGINPYDPQQNIEGIARYVNQLIGSSRGNVREALAKYNGGNNPPSSSYGYADGIISRLA